MIDQIVLLRILIGYSIRKPFVCGNTCNFHSDCSYSQDGCYFCNNGFCSSINPSCGNEKTCVNNNGLFQDALNNPDVDRITICENTILTLRSTGDAFSSGRSGFTVECGGGMCQFIRTAGSGRFLNFSGSGITLVGLYFDNGTGSGTGGAVFIEGFNNRIENCVFRDNTATNGGSGGAVWWGSGTVVGSGGYDNIATGMCDGVFSNNDGSCNDSVNSGTPSQCGRFCTKNSDCNGEQGPCTTCNVNSNRCQVPGSSKTCVSTETMLQDALQDSNSAAPVEICSNANIFLNQQISTSLSNKSLLCQGGARTCTIQRAPNSANFRLLNFSGNNIELTNINFVNGKAPSGDGGAVLLSGTNNIVTNCEFTTNSAVRNEFLHFSASQFLNSFLTSTSTFSLFSVGWKGWCHVDFYRNAGEQCIQFKLRATMF